MLLLMLREERYIVRKRSHFDVFEDIFTVMEYGYD